MKRQKIAIILMLAMFVLLTSCDDGKTDNDELVVETRIDFAYDFPYTVNGEEHSYVKYEEILGFFRITSPDSITSVDVYTRSYNEKDDSFGYVFYGTFVDIGGEVYELLSTMEKDFIAKRYYIAGEATAEKRKSWADGVIKLDVTLTSGIVLPVFYSETTDCFAIMDSVSDFSGRPDETAAESLKAALGLS